MINSRNKGKRIELELVHVFQTYGFNTRRGDCFRCEPDVIGLKWIHVEVKGYAKFTEGNKEAAFEQAVGFLKWHGIEDEMPFVFHRENRSRWYVTTEHKCFSGLMQGKIFPPAKDRILVTTTLEGFMNLYKKFKKVKEFGK